MGSRSVTWRSVIGRNTLSDLNVSIVLDLCAYHNVSITNKTQQCPLYQDTLDHRSMTDFVSSDLLEYVLDTREERSGVVIWLPVGGELDQMVRDDVSQTQEIQTCWGLLGTPGRTPQKDLHSQWTTCCAFCLFWLLPWAAVARVIVSLIVALKPSSGHPGEGGCWAEGGVLFYSC